MIPKSQITSPSARRRLLPLALAPFLSALLPACGSQARQSVDVPVAISAKAALPSFDLADGTHFEVDTATFAFHDVRFEEPPEVAGLGWPALVPTALAHPGHDFAGAASGELLGNFEVDLLAGRQPLGEATLLCGSYATARLQWPAGAPAAVLSGTVTVVAGTPIPFSFSVGDEREIAGMDFETEVSAVSPPSGLTLGLDLARMLSSSDWTTADGDGDGALTAADGALGNTVPFGVRTSAAWTWEIE